MTAGCILPERAANEKGRLVAWIFNQFSTAEKGESPDWTAYCLRHSLVPHHTKVLHSAAKYSTDPSQIKSGIETGKDAAGTRNVKARKLSGQQITKEGLPFHDKREQDLQS